MERVMAEIVAISVLGAAGALFALYRAVHHTWHIEVIRSESGME